MSAYRYYRWNITATKGGGTTQAQEFYLRNNGAVIAWPSGTVASNLTGSSPVGQEPDKIIDGSSGTKWLQNDGGACTLKFDCLVATEVKGYSWMTGDDVESRDPITWTFAGSNDDLSYTTLDTVTSATITSSRTTLVGPWDYEAASSGVRRRHPLLTNRRDVKKPVSRIVTRAWAGPPRVMEAPVISTDVGVPFVRRRRRGWLA